MSEQKHFFSFVFAIYNFFSFICFIFFIIFMNLLHSYIDLKSLSGCPFLDVSIIEPFLHFEYYNFCKLCCKHRSTITSNHTNQKILQVLHVTFIINLVNYREISINERKKKNLLGQFCVIVFFEFYVLLFNQGCDAKLVDLVSSSNYYGVDDTRSLFHQICLKDW